MTDRCTDAESSTQQRNGELADAALKTYSPELERMGYFCDICGREARDAGGVELYEHVDGDALLVVCKNRCLP